MGWTTGDAIEIQGRRRPTRSCRRQNLDAGKGIIRIDGSIRNNAGTGIDDKIVVTRIEAGTAESVTLAPTEPLRITGGEEYLGSCSTEG